MKITERSVRGNNFKTRALPFSKSFFFKKTVIMNWYFAVLQKYFVFDGRARRSEYWYFVLFNFVVSFCFGFAGGFLKMPLLSTFYSLAVFVPTVAVSVRRMHDVGKSGAYCLIPFYNLILACREGDQGENKYGSNPKENNLSFN